jgi:integrase/recombinase XerC
VPDRGNIRDYQQDQRRRGLLPGTVKRTGDVLANLARHAPLLEATPADVEAWLDRTPLVARTRYSYLSHLSAFYDWTQATGRTDGNPARKIPRPKLRRGLPRPIDPGDLAHAVRQAPPRERCWLLLAALAGLRCQEIAGVHRDDVIDREVPAVLVVSHAKGGHQRIVPMHDEILFALRVYGLPRQGPVFLSSSGRPFSPGQVSKLGNAYLRSVGADWTMHSLRHRFGTDVFRQSRDLRLTQELLGHQSPNSTAIYTAWSPGEAATVVRALTWHPPSVDAR